MTKLGRIYTVVLFKLIVDYYSLRNDPSPPVMLSQPKHLFSLFFPFFRCLRFFAPIKAGQNAQDDRRSF